jgi:aspartyl protease family protein
MYLAFLPVLLLSNPRARSLPMAWGTDDLKVEMVKKAGVWHGVGLALLLGVSAPAMAVEVVLAGVFPGKAVLVVDGGPPRTVAVGGRTPEGVRLLESSGGSALIEVDGRRERLELGQAALRSIGGGADDSTLSLVADTGGHYYVQGSINDATVRFLLDTGASMVSMGPEAAKRAGIDYRRGVPRRAQTANGVATVWQVRLDRVRVGNLTLHGVDGLVHEHDLPFVLLGMSVLGRMDMQREGDRLMLRKRY